MSAVAGRAGVTRATVYRHFATEESLLLACSRIAFTTWQSLCGEQGLSHTRAVELMVGMVEHVSR